MPKYRRLTTTDKYGKPVVYVPTAWAESAVVYKAEAVQTYPAKMLVVDTYVLSGELVDALYEREESIAKYVEQALRDMAVYLRKITPEGSDYYTISIDNFTSKCNDLIEQYRIKDSMQDVDCPVAKVDRTVNISEFAERIKEIIHRDENISDSEDEYLCDEIDELVEEMTKEKNNAKKF